MDSLTSICRYAMKTETKLKMKKITLKIIKIFETKRERKIQLYRHCPKMANQMKILCKGFNFNIFIENAPIIPNERIVVIEYKKTRLHLYTKIILKVDSMNK